MNLVKKLLIGDGVASKSSSAPTATASAATQSSGDPRLVYEREIASPLVASSNFMELYNTIPEVFFPIEFIASRIAKVHFDIKQFKDDSIVFCNRRMSKIFAKPNPIMSWSELVHQHFVYKLVTGNSFFRGAIPGEFSTSPLYKVCNHFWVLPPTGVKAVPVDYRLPLYGVSDIADIIKCYRLNTWGQYSIDIPVNQIWHDRDGMVNLETGVGFLMSRSRLGSVKKAISNLIAVYEARNVIYVKRGGLGFLVSQKHDATGTPAMTPKEREQVTKHLTTEYGIGAGQSPIGVSDVPMSFLRTNLSINELQPFEETLQDAITIAGAYGIPDVLVPRKDHSTFNNQATAEKAVYSSVIIPMAKQFCNDMTVFLGLDQNGLYMDCDFSDVDCLQIGLKEAEDVKRMVNERCMAQFDKGLITLNDWRAQIYESQIDEEEDPLFSKLKFQMTDEELARVAKIHGGASITATPQNDKPIINNNPSTGEGHERNEEESALSDQS